MFTGGVGGIDIDGIARFADTANERLAVIGDFTAGNVALTIAYVIRYGGNFQNIC